MRKRLLTGLLALAASAFLIPDISHAAAYSFGLTVVDYPAGAYANGIGASRHNMGSMGHVITSNGSNPSTFYTTGSGGTSEICVFCHTPHFTNMNYGLAPLWNRGTAAPSAYTMYGTTLGGSVMTTGSMGPATLACMSCHDGVTTFDNIVNAPAA